VSNGEDLGFYGNAPTETGSAANVDPVVGSFPLHPLSFAQQRIWFLQEWDRSKSTYNQTLALRVHGLLKLTELSRAIADVVARHEILRTVYPVVDGKPYQQIIPVVAVPDIRVCTYSASEAAIPELLAAFAGLAFDLVTELPLRACAVEISPDEQILLLVIHHIAIDGHSTGPLLRDLDTAYSARCACQEPNWDPLPIQYREYAERQRDAFGASDGKPAVVSAEQEYWKSVLAGLPDELVLPTDRSRQAVASFEGGHVLLSLDAQLHSDLVRLARGTRSSLLMVFHAALAALLSRLGAGSDIPLGTIVSGRADEELSESIGVFVNTVVLRTDVSGNPTFRELLARARDVDLDAYSHQEIPFDLVVEAVNPVRSAARHALFQVMIIFQTETRTPPKLADLTVEDYLFEVPTAHFDLSMDVWEDVSDGQFRGIHGDIAFSHDLFDRRTAELIASRLKLLLRAVAADPDLHIRNVDLLTVEEHRQLTVTWNETDRDIPADGVHALFARQAADSPDVEAVTSDGVTLTYGELNARANQLAHEFISMGITTGDIVAFSLPRSEHILEVILGILKAGAAYLPVDPTFPADRIDFLLHDATPALLLTGTGPMPSEPPPGIPIMHIGGAGQPARPGQWPTANPEPVAGDHPAYVLYTSGSTGRPKGVVVGHQSLSSFAQWASGRPEFAGSRRVALTTSINFDVSVLEIFPPLISGKAIDVLPDLLALPTAALDLADTVVSGVPSAVAAILGESFESNPSAIMFCGEELKPDLVRRTAAAFPGSRVVNAYGPTEATVYATTWVADSAEPTRVPIGRPIDNTRAYVLDERLSPVPLGVIGELYLAGRCLAHGYLGRPGLTAERFVPDPFTTSGQRMYRTGDLARWTPAGELEFFGRVDRQLKVRGFRIEPGEIEAVISTHPDVGQAVVVVREDQTGEPRLVAYVVPAEDETALQAEDIRAHVAARLPSYMVPAAVSLLEELPLTPNMKLDVRGLPAPDYKPTGISRRPRDGREESLCALFSELLALEDPGIDDSFFDLGGTSLLAIRLMRRIRTVFGAKIGIRSFFDAPTVADISLLIEAANSDSQ
jgi:amino acid adenylation domain-containing protein